MKTAARFALLASLLLLACDDKEDPSKTAGGEPTAATAATAEPKAAPSESAAPPASAAPSASASAAAATGDTDAKKEATIAVRDPVKEPEKTLHALRGGSVTLYLPRWAGTTWKVKKVDRTLGKPKEETIPGFAGPKTPAQAFKWSTDTPLIKAGSSHVVVLHNEELPGKKSDKAGATFTLTIDIAK